MKKLLLGFVLIFGINAIAFSLEEGWISLGANWGNYFDRGSELGSVYIGSPGINLSSYAFWNQKNIGMFVSCDFFFPVVENIENNYKPIGQIDLMVGPGFKYAINEALKVYAGIGFDINWLSLMDRINEDEKTTDTRKAFGIGGDIGLKYDLTDLFYINVGTTVTYNFAGYQLVRSTADNWTNTKTETSRWIHNYSLIGIKPYIAIGFNYYQEKVHWGKPST
ncbi:MAG: hypothetical protein LBF75_07870 [Treponema sp.]|jgi:opacity protein-like surface antigen|nr:hypothetical protein [Treponema sp.]